MTLPCSPTPCSQTACVSEATSNADCGHATAAGFHAVSRQPLVIVAWYFRSLEEEVLAGGLIWHAHKSCAERPVPSQSEELGA